MERRKPFGVVWTAFFFLLSLIVSRSAVAGVTEDLSLLRNQCLYYSAGHAPADSNTTTIRHGLYAQSPFSKPGEVDLAASGFSLACLPAAVANNVINSNAAYEIAANAAHEARLMMAKSAAATTPEDIRRYGYGGMLCHYPLWDDASGEFHAQPGVEFSSIDTTLLLYGLMVSSEYFGGEVRTDYEAARNAIRWSEWFDKTTPGHRNQVRMSYWPGSGFFAWWDWYTQEAMLVDLMAAMSDDSIEPVKMWQAWRRDRQTYTSPGPDSHSFTCYTTFFGDPFTVLYGQAFLDFARFPLDVDSQNWFQQAQIDYMAHVEFFKKERGYLGDLTSGFSICAPNGAMAKPNGKRLEPVARNDATIYTLAGALSYFGDDPESNPLAIRLSGLLEHNPDFIGWHGWPVASVNATNPAFPVSCERIIGQDIAFIGLTIDNYLSHRAQNLVLQDPNMRRTLNRIFPPRTLASWTVDSQQMELACHGIPFTAMELEKAQTPLGIWSGLTNTAFGPDGFCRVSFSTASSEPFYRLEPRPHPGPHGQVTASGGVAMGPMAPAVRASK